MAGGAPAAPDGLAFRKACTICEFPSAEVGDLRIHAFGGDLETWLSNHEDLASSRAVYALDLPGHGGSSKGVGTGTPGEFRQVLAGFMDAVGLGAAHLVGHSMGGHGALTIGLKNPERYCSISAFAPISAPMHCPWGQKAFAGYLGPDRDRWREHDACELIRALTSVTGRPPLLVDQGLADQFLGQQLMPERLEKACKDAGYPLTLRRQPGYDHGYYFISTFIEDHLRHHARTLLA
jgi:pimeloyl-ACP methyl ester carboxylesterase